MTAAEFEARVREWAGARHGIVALVQIGSRAQAAGEVDEWSDWDYHLLVRNPRSYLDADWVAEIAPPWCMHAERTERSVTKISAVFPGGIEADFVPLPAWQVRLACWGLRHPNWRGLFPGRLRQGIENFRLIVRPGYRVVLGGKPWEMRYAAVREPWPEATFTAEDFQRCQSAFWRHVIWVFKKAARGEARAAARWHGREVMEALYPILEEEARLAGRPARPEARRAENWLDPVRLRQTGLSMGCAGADQARALLATVDAFADAARAVANARGFTPIPHADVERWLRAELERLANGR